MLENWRKSSKLLILSLFFVNIIGSCNTFIDNAEHKQLIKLLNEVLPKGINNRQEIIVLTGYTCLTCYDNRLVYSINKYASCSDIYLTGIVFSEVNLESELVNLRNSTAKNIDWIEANNIDLMILLSRITNDKDGPYFIKFENMEVIEVTAF